jgi:hypothetical protein
MIKSRRMRWARHVACSIMVKKPEGKEPLGHRWEDNINIDFRDVERGGMVCFSIGTSGGLL